ncbi:MAG TPA: cation-transporting P-type ATPase, partial [Mycobacterium sp.]|nr:cation-transporting P-type ATPase [Mycobacterium sp.]
MTATADDSTLTAVAVADVPLADVLARLDTSAEGLSSTEAAARLARVGPNSLRTHRVSAWAVLRRQLNNAVLMLLAVTAVVSFFL